MIILCLQFKLRKISKIRINLRAIWVQQLGNCLLRKIRSPISWIQVIDLEKLSPKRINELMWTIFASFDADQAQPYSRESSKNDHFFLSSENFPITYPFACPSQHLRQPNANGTSDKRDIDKQMTITRHTSRQTDRHDLISFQDISGTKPARKLTKLWQLIVPIDVKLTLVNLHNACHVNLWPVHRQKDVSQHFLKC